MLATMMLTALMASALVGAGIATGSPTAAAASSGSPPTETAEDSTEASSGSDDDLGRSGVEVVRYAGSNQHALSLAVAQALVDAEGGSSEWVVLASGESWADAAAAGPLAASLAAPVVLVPPGGLQTASARPDLVGFLRSAGVRRVVIVGSPDVLPNHEPSVLFGLGMLPRNIERVHVDDAVGTAIAVAERMGMPTEFADLGRTAIIVSDQSVADAVALGPLAASGPFPVLLTAPDALDPRIASYLAEHEITHVMLVGGTTAITPSVHESIETAGATVTRLAGRDRSDTARLAADLFKQHTADDPACADSPVRIGLAPTQQPEQALAAGPLLAAQCTPLRYTEPDQLSADLRNALYLASRRSEGARVMVFADESTILDSLTAPSVPPARMAFEGGWPPDHPRHGEFAVVVVDERGRWHRYPVESGHSLDLDPGGWGSELLEWSPDGRYLAYISARDHQLLVIDIETGEVYKSELEDVQLRFSRLLQLAWSPDSAQLAFSATPEGAEYTEVFIFDSETRSTTRLTENETSEEVLAWSPDGTAIALTQSTLPANAFGHRYLHSFLVILDIETGSMTQLHESRFNNLNVLWAPDGKHLAFSGIIEPPTDEFFFHGYLAQRDGSGLQQFASADGFVGVDAWDEAGARLLYSKNYSAPHRPTEWWIRKLDTHTDSPLGFAAYMPHYLLGWSLDQRGILFRLGGVLDEPYSPLDSLVGVDVDTGIAEQLMTFRIRMPDRYESGLGLSPDHEQLAFIVDNNQLLIVNHSAPQGMNIIDFSAEGLSRRVSCDGSWTDAGIRGRCERWPDT